jgi:hypothetical protein
MMMWKVEENCSGLKQGDRDMILEVVGCGCGWLHYLDWTARDHAYPYMMLDYWRVLSETHQSNKQDRVKWTGIVPSKCPIPKRDVVVAVAEHDLGRESDTGFQRASDSLDDTLRWWTESQAVPGNGHNEWPRRMIDIKTRAVMDRTSRDGGSDEDGSNTQTALNVCNDWRIDISHVRTGGGVGESEM